MNEHVDDLIAAYALDALTPEEQRQVEAHVRTCTRCGQEIDEFRAVADILPLSLEPVQPPPRLKTQLLAAAHASTATPAAFPADARQNAVTTPWYRRLLATPYPAVTAAAIAMALIIGILAGRALAPTTPSAQQRYTQLIGQFVLRGDRVVRFQPIGKAKSSELALVAAPHAAPLLVVGRMPQPPPGKVYQVWFLNTLAHPVSAGVFQATGQIPARITLRHNPLRYKLAALTIEPGPRGSPRPTSAPFTIAPLSSL